MSRINQSKSYEIENRVLEEAHWYLDHDTTVREESKEFMVSKTTVWKDLHERLKEIDPELYAEVQRKLDKKAKLATFYMNEHNRLSRMGLK